ncbi:MAG: hypothetical protein U0528_17315 [Anaerolineae bacterium]|nr:hypothetical protein [Anaerolineae bacterium]
MRFPYRSEPTRQAILVIAVLIILGLVIPSALLQLILFSTAAGAAAWMLLQVLRGRTAVLVHDDSLIVEHSLTGRQRRIDWDRVRGAIESRREGLILAYEIPAPAAMAAAPRALTDAHTNAAKPRLLLIITPALEHIGGLLSEIHARAVQSTLEPERLQRMARRRRLRGYVLLAVAILGIPVYIYIIMKTIAFIR